jgi:histidinol-phosphate aminotransferase
VTSTRTARFTQTATHRMDLLPNPFAPSLQVLDSLSSDEQFRRPAKALAGALIERIAASEGISPDWIALGAGINDLLVAIMRSYGRPNNVVLFPPTDPGTEHLASRLGLTAIRVPRSSQYTLDLDRPGLSPFPPAALSIVQHPNDPTGTPVTVQEAVRLVRRSRLLVVDERHGRYGSRSLLPLVREFDRIVVLRTFETWAGLGSLPIAIAFGAPDVIARITAEQMVSVSTAPLIAAHATLDDFRSVESSVIRIKDEKARLYRMLRKLNMLRPFPSWANFVLTHIERGDASTIRSELLSRGILVHAPDERELEGCLRITATSHDATAALRAALIELAPIL